MMGAPSTSGGRGAPLASTTARWPMQTVGDLAALQPLCSLDAKVVDVPVFVPLIHYNSRVGRKFGCAGPHVGVVPETLGSEPYLAPAGGGPGMWA